ncbi:MAG: cation diffusion facilitator family transporter [Leptospirillum sp.]|jgi:cation diffusion facilitator family transporter
MKSPAELISAGLSFFGFGGSSQEHHDHSHSSSHVHTHGHLDSTITTTQEGIRAVKWSFLILLITAGLQFGIVLYSGSIALASDMIHNIADATTAFPLWVAFRLARLKPNARFHYGFGRVEDLAGVVIVVIILLSASLAAYEALDRFLHPRILTHLGWLVVAGLAGFLGNELVAIFRIRVGRKIKSAALIADGLHARTDGITSLAVVGGAIGVWLGFPLADPIVGFLISIAIFGIVWQSAKAVFRRMLDGSEPAILDEVIHAADHVQGIFSVKGIRARWVGHKICLEVDAIVDGKSSVSEANKCAMALEEEIREHLPATLFVHVRICPDQ